MFFIADHTPRMVTEIAESHLRYEFDLIRLSEVDYNLFLSSALPDEVVFAALGNLGTDDFPTAARRIIRRLAETSPSNLELDRYFEQLRVLVNLRKLKPFVEQIMDSVLKYFDPEIDPWYIKGKEEGKRELILKFLKDGVLTTEQIAFYFDVSPEQVEALRAELNK